MRKLITIILINISLLALLTVPVLAVTIPNPVSPVFADFESTLETLGNWVPGFGVLGLLVSIVWGAFTIETAGGSPENVKKGWAIIRAGITGFILLVLTPTIVQLVGSIIGTGNLLI